MRQLLIATKNAHKTAEIRAILGAEWQISDLTAHPDFAAPEETGATFLENATIKAVAASRTFEGLVLADDSGLEIDALQGAPGVFSARYARPNATDSENRAKVLHELAQCGSADRRARFRCVLTLAQKGVVLMSFEGDVAGSIVAQEHGNGGFGYDPLFVPTGFTETFGALAAAVKNEISHRGRALARAAAFLRRCG